MSSCRPVLVRASLNVNIGNKSFTKINLLPFFNNKQKNQFLRAQYDDKDDVYVHYTYVVL